MIAPEDPNVPEELRRIRELAPDFLFSFYYRLMLMPELLAIAARGALNMHGSLLPKYRGRVPVNWAIIHGETETGATLHYMVEKPDAGDLVAQTAVPILPDDTAKEVFNKVTVAAELTLHRVLPALLAGTAPRIAQDLSRAAISPAASPRTGASTGTGRRRGFTTWSARSRRRIQARSPSWPGSRRILGTRVVEAVTLATAAVLERVGDRLVAHYCRWRCPARFRVGDRR